MWTEETDLLAPAPPQGPAAHAPMACRCMLITCGLYPHQYGRGEVLGADIVTLDVEDSVPPASKPEARRLVKPFFAQERRPGLTRVMRINALRTDEGLRDILTLLDWGAAPDALMVPKVESAEDLRILEQLLCGRWERLGFFPIIETARGLCAVESILTSTPRIRAVVLGTADLAASLGTTRSWEHMAYARSRLLAAAAAAEVPAIDSPCFDMADAEALRAEVRRASEMGFAGKCAIHPRHVAAINETFTPSPAAIAQARRILACIRDNGGRIAVLDGEMIGPPAVVAARRLLARVGEQI